MPVQSMKFLPLAAAIALLGCGRPEATPTSAPEQAASGVSRERIDPTPTPTQAPIVQAAIQTQPGPTGTQVALNKVAVTGDILTVQLTYSGGTDNTWQTPSIADVAVIVDATAQKLGVLRDGEQNYMASPINGGVRRLLGFRTGTGPQIVWFKFPAPPADARTVSINIPDVVPFDGVPVTR